MTFISVADSPELLKDWSYDLNDKKPQEVPVKAGMKFFWKGSDCGHSWDESPAARSNLNRGCLVCAGIRIISGINDFSTLYPEIASKALRPNDFPINLHPGSNVCFDFICEESHVFKKSPADLSNANKLICSICTNRQVLKGFNDLSSRFPDVAAEFHPTLNYPHTPENIFCYRKLLAWWICYRSHEWQARVDARTGQNQGCPYCSGRLAIPGETDLVTKFPKVAETWDYDLNGDLDPTQLKPFTHKFVWWKCPKDHSSYRQQISKRTARGTECPECSKGRGTSKGEFELAAFITSLGYDYIQGSRKFLQGMEVDLFVESGRRGLEYNGEWMHCNDSLKPDSIDASFRDYHLRKLDQAEATGVDLVFVWEHDWEEHRSAVESAVVIWFETGRKSPLLERLISYKDMPKTCCDVRV